MKLTRNGWIYEIEIHSFEPGRPGKVTGPAEGCYPEEHPEIDYSVLSITSDGGDYSDLLTETELEAKLLSGG